MGDDDVRGGRGGKWGLVSFFQRLGQAASCAINRAWSRVLGAAKRMRGLKFCREIDHGL